jgi:heterodisulfide reductase subunit C
MGEVEKVFISGLAEKLSEDKIITEKELDPEFAQEIIRYGGKDVMTCLQCGNCTGVCPISLKIEYKTRTTIKYCQFGMRKQTLETRWVCATCYRCYEHCPADLNPAEVMIALRHIAIREGIIPPFVKIAATNLLNFGLTVRPDEAMIKERHKMGLPDLPQSKPGWEEVKKQIATIIQTTKYDRLLGIASKEGSE